MSETRATVSKNDVAPASRMQVKASIGIDGVSGDGKSGTALEIAHYLEPDWEKIHATDAENQSLSLFVGLPLQSDKSIVGPFQHAKMNKETGYSPFNYAFFREDAIEKGCTVAIMDSATHMWQRDGGVLDMVNKQKSKTKGQYTDAHSAWGHPDVIDAKNLIFDLVRDDKLHVISTVRIKEAYIRETDDKGNTKIVSAGEKQMQSDGLQYEFDLLLRMVRPANAETDIPARAEVLKSRYRILKKGEVYDLTPELFRAIRDYLKEGTSPQELEAQLMEELKTGLKERALANKMLKTIFVNLYPGRKIAELNLKELRDLNSKFLEIEKN